MPNKGSSRAFVIPRGELLSHALKYVASQVGATSDDGEHGEAYWTAFTDEDKIQCGGGTPQEGFLAYITSRYNGKGWKDTEGDWDNTNAKPLTVASLKSRTTRCIKMLMQQYEVKLGAQADDASVPVLKHWLVNPPKPAKKEEIVFVWPDLKDEAQSLGILGFESVDLSKVK